MERIANSCRLERTPTFAKMEEQELRNIILSDLNSVYEGNAERRGLFQARQTQSSNQI